MLDQSVDRAPHRQWLAVNRVGDRFERQAHGTRPIAGEMRRHVQQERALDPGKAFGSANVD